MVPAFDCLEGAFMDEWPQGTSQRLAGSRKPSTSSYRDKALIFVAAFRNIISQAIGSTGIFVFRTISSTPQRLLSQTGATLIMWTVLVNASNFVVKQNSNESTGSLCQEITAAVGSKCTLGHQTVLTGHFVNHLLQMKLDLRIQDYITTTEHIKIILQSILKMGFHLPAKEQT